jgi:hypothetical protein
MASSIQTQPIPLLSNNNNNSTNYNTTANFQNNMYANYPAYNNMQNNYFGGSAASYGYPGYNTQPMSPINYSSYGNNLNNNNSRSQSYIQPSSGVIVEEGGKKIKIDVVQVQRNREQMASSRNWNKKGLLQSM